MTAAFHRPPPSLPCYTERSVPGSVDAQGWTGTALAATALWAAWLPVETHPTAAVVVAVALGVVAVALRPAWSSPAAWAVAAVTLVVSALGGGDVARAVGQLALLAGMAVAWWLASRAPPSRRHLELVAVGLCLLGAWGVVQTLTAGPGTAADLGLVEPGAAGYVAERLQDGRAFASLLFPGHLAALLAMALALAAGPELFAKRRALRILCLGAAALGLLATRSPVGVALGVGAVAAVLLARRSKLLLPVLLAGVIAGAAVLALRPDARVLEPLRLRAQNWQTALWTFSTAPVAGVGFGGYAQASQEVPFEVGNRPAHAHSLPLELLAELGVAGLAACVAGAALLLWLAVRVWPRCPGLAVAVVVVPLHNLVDFSLYVSGVAIPWAVLLGWATALARGTDAAPVPRFTPRMGAAVVGVAAAGLAIAVTLHQASRLLDEPAWRSEVVADRLAAARLAHRLAPWRLDPALFEAVAALGGGADHDRSAAASVLEEVRWLRPGSAAAAELRGRLAASLGDRPLAAGELRSAAAARPFDPTFRLARDRFLESLTPNRGNDDG